MLKMMVSLFVLCSSAWGVVPGDPSISVSAKCLTKTVTDGHLPIVYLEITNKGAVDVIVNLDGLSLSPMYEFPDGAMEIINATAIDKPAVAGGTASLKNWQFSTNAVGIGPKQKIFRVMELPTPKRSIPGCVDSRVGVKVIIEVSFFAGKFINKAVEDWVLLKRNTSTPLTVWFE